MRALSIPLLIMVCSGAYAQDWGQWITVFPPDGNADYEGVVQISFKERGCEHSPYSFYRISNTIKTDFKDYIDFDFYYQSCDGKREKQRVTVFLNQPGLNHDIGNWFIGQLVDPVANLRLTPGYRPDLNKHKDTFRETQTRINTSTSVLFSISHDMKDEKKKELGDKQEGLQQRAAEIQKSFNQHIQQKNESLIIQDVEDLRQIQSEYATLETWARASVESGKAEDSKAREDASKDDSVKEKDAKEKDSDSDGDNNNQNYSPPPMTQEQLDALDLQNRIESHKQLEKTVSQSQTALAQSMATIVGTDGGAAVFDELGMGMNFGVALGGKGVPQVGNTASSTNAIIPYSSGMDAINLGLQIHTDLWLLRNEFFGIGGDANVFYGYGAFGGATSSLTTYGYNLKAQAGFRSFKAHFLLGRDYRSGSYSNDLDVSSASINISTNTHAYTAGDIDYTTTRIGGGFIFDFSDDEERYVSYSLILDRPDFLPQSHKAIKVHQLVYRDVVDIIVSVGNKYPLSGKPLYEFQKDGRNQMYFFFGIGKTFTLFQTN